MRSRIRITDQRTVTGRPHDWMDDASCAPLPGFGRLPLARQKAICAGCPVRQPCEAWATAPPTGATAHDWPTYGGLSAAELAEARDRKLQPSRVVRCPPDGRHDCPTGYHPTPCSACYNHGCGCGECRAARATEQREQRARRAS